MKENVMVVQPRGSRLSESKYSVCVKWDFEIEKRDRQSATKKLIKSQLTPTFDTFYLQLSREDQGFHLRLVCEVS